MELVREHISSDTVEALQQLLDGAHKGEVIGLAMVVMLKRRRYIVDCSGEACRSPTFARGAVQALDDELRSRIWHESDNDTTF